MDNTVWSVSCWLFFYSRPPPCPAICKSGEGHVPSRDVCSRRLCFGCGGVAASRMQMALAKCASNYKQLSERDVNISVDKTHWLKADLYAVNIIFIFIRPRSLILVYTLHYCVSFQFSTTLRMLLGCRVMCWSFFWCIRQDKIKTAFV